MKKRSKNRKRLTVKLKRRVTSKLLRVNRYSLNKRSLVSFLPRVHFTRDKTLQPKIISPRVTSYKPFRPFNNSALSEREQSRCIEKTRNADLVRKRAFFRSKSKGGTSERPAHNRNHKRC